MKIRREYTYTNNRQIWRLLPVQSGRLIIEERNPATREAFFTCIKLATGSFVFNNLQFDEKFWIGIETISDDIIFFNKYSKPEMPQHKGIFAYDINEQRILWHNNDYIFLFLKDQRLYCYVQKFEGRKYFSVNYLTGEFIEEYDDYSGINILREEAADAQSFEGYFFPERFPGSEEIDVSIADLLNEFKTTNVVVGNLEYVHFHDLLLVSSFEPGSSGLLNNIFRAIDIESGKVIFEETLTAEAGAPVLDSFFIKDNVLYLLQGKTKLLICSLTK